MIRVLHIQETVGYGGVERLRLSLAKLLDKEKYILKIICTQAVGSIADDIRSYNVELIEIGKFNSIFHFSQHQKVQKIIHEYKPHIIHGAVFEGVTMAAINGFLKRVPIIILEETSDPKNRSWKGHLLMKFFCKFSDKVIGVSAGVADYLQKELKIKSNKVTQIDNGVVVPKSLSELEKQNLRNKLDINKNEIIIGSVGRMLSDEHKRFSDLIYVLKNLRERGLNVKLILVGEGPERKKYQQLAEELQVDSKVIFTGYQSNVTQYYSIFDIFSLVSSYEAFGLVLAEAMLHKLPVVATSVGGMKYIVENNETGFLVPKHQVKVISQKLYDLCIDPKLRAIMGQNGYMKAMEHYTEEKYVEKIQNLYENLITSKKIKIQHVT